MYNSEDIEQITVKDAQRWTQKAVGVPSLPEQILFKKATEHKSNGNMNLAIECLKKANQLLPQSACTYQRTDYERLVNYLVDARRFEEAREEHKKLDRTIGSRLEHLERIKNETTESEEKRKKYETEIIMPIIEEERDREEYYWLMEHMVNEAPKSFSGYRRMKLKKTENYEKLLKTVKAFGNQLNQVRFWY